jgi:site-specific DNA recombinase
MSTEMNEYQALEMKRKSILSRIERAKNNHPSTGKLPYGRTFDKKSKKWGIDEDNRQKIVWAAEQYLNGKSMSEIAESLGMNHPNLWKILKQRSGPEWINHFNDERLNISETITLTIPALLPQETIDAIEIQSQKNKTYEHGHIKHKYLFSRMIFCAECGYAMFGQTNHSKRRYYRHARNRKKECKHGGIYVSADLIEEAVFVKIFALSGDTPKIEQAVRSSADKYGDYSKLSEEQKVLSKELKKIAKQKSNLINAIANGHIDDNDIKDKMDTLKEQESKLEKLLTTSKKKISSIPSPQEIKRRSKWVEKVILKAARNTYGRGRHYLKMTWEDKRKLCELLFSGTDLDGKRAGVYLSKDDNDNLHYEVHGIIDTQVNGQLPITQLEVMDLLKVDPDDLELQQDLFSKCYAYYGLCLHK